jgi:zinc protease
VPQQLQKERFSASMNDWPHSISDIKPDQRVEYGRLKNGLRYAILPVPDIDGTVSIQMNVSVGFRDEPENLYGIAHLLEHMAFRSTVGKGEDSVVHHLQSEGVAFGYDLNGFTSNENTYYLINLASAKGSKVSEALESLSQMVISPAITAPSLESEKKVVLAELKQRDTRRARSNMDYLRFTYPNRVRYEVAGAGTPESLDSITLDDVEKFYASHYTPDNSFLVIAGGVDLKRTKRKISHLFSDWSKNTVAPKEPPHPSHDVDFSEFPSEKHFIEDGARTSLSFIQNTASTLQNDTQAVRQKIFAERMANSIIRSRLKPRIEAEKQVNWINLYKSRFEEYDISSVKFGAKDYAKAASLFEEERLKALKFGFTKAEIDFELEKEFAALSEASKQPETIKAWSEASQLRVSYSVGDVYTNAAQKLTQFETFSRDLTAHDYHMAAQEMWDDFNPRYWTTSRSDNMKQRLAKAREAIDDMATTDIAKPVDKIAEFSLDNGLTEGRVKSRDIFTKNKIHRLLFENGSRLNYLRRKTEKDNIEIKLIFKGDFEAYRSLYSAIQEQSVAFSRADIKGVTKSKMDRRFVGQKTDFSLSMSDKNLILYAQTQPSDLDDTLDLITAFILDIDILSEDQKQKTSNQESNTRAYSNQSPLVTGLLKIPYIYSGREDAFASKAGGQYINTNDTLNTLEAIIKHGRIEVGVVGDFEPTMLIDSFANSLGALPKRSQKNVKADTERSNIHIEPAVTSFQHLGSDEQMAVFYCWPISITHHKTKQVIHRLSTQIIKNRIMKTFREDLGLTYSPHKFSYVNRAFPEFQYSCFYFQITPKDEMKVHETFKQLLEKLRTSPITKKELTRARKPMLSSSRRNLHFNKFLVSSVASAYSSPEMYKTDQTYISRLKKISLKNINAYVSKNFKPLESHIFRVETKGQKWERTTSDSLGYDAKSAEVGAILGKAKSQYEFGKALLSDPDTDDKTRALSLLQKAAEQNYKPAHLTLGKYYEGRYYSNESQDFKKAAHHLKLSKNKKEGTFLLAELYFRNPNLFPDISDKDVVELYRVSAETGYSYAQQALANRYKDGSMIKRNLVTAYKWALLSQSTKNGLFKGVVKNKDNSFLHRFQKDLTQVEKDLAIEQAADWINHFDDKLD